MRANLIFKSVFRELVRSRWRTLAVVTILSVGVAVTTGMYSAKDTLLHTRDVAYAESGLADLEIRFIPEDRYNIPDIGDIKGVSSAEYRMIMPGFIPLSGQQRCPALLYFIPDPSRTKVNRLRVLEGSIPDSGQGDWILAERSLAEYRGIRPGDRLDVTIGYRTYESEVAAIVFSPEYLITASSGDFLVPQKGALGVLYTPLDRFYGNMGFQLVNSACFTFAPGLDHKALRRKLTERLSERLQIEEVIPSEDQFAYRWLKLDMESFTDFIPSMILIFALVGCLASMILFSRMIHSRRKEIGTAMALGYSRTSIFMAYLAAGVLIAVFSVAIGLILAVLIRDLFVQDYLSNVGLMEAHSIMPLSRVLAGILYAFIVSLTAMAGSLLRIVRMNPLRAMRLELSDPGSSPVRVSARRSFTIRYAIRNLVRHRLLTVTTIVCIALSLSVVMAYFVTLTSFDRTFENFFASYPWDLIMDFHTRMWPEDIQELASTPGISGYEVRLTGYVAFQSSRGVFDSKLIGVPHDASIILPPHRRGQDPRQCGEGDVVLETVLARKLGVDVGDRLRMDVQNRSYDVRVIGICAGISGRTSFGSIGYAREVMETGEMSSVIILDLDPGVSPADMKSRLLAHPDVSNITLQEDIVGSFKELLSEYYFVLYAATALSISVAVIFIISTLLLTVIERQEEFATMRVVGVEPGACYIILLWEATVQMVASILLSIPFSLLIASYLNARMSLLWFEILLRPAWMNYLTVIIPALITVPLCAYPGFQFIRNMDLSLTIRTRIIE